MSELTKDQLLNMVEDLRHKLEKADARADAAERKSAAYQQQIATITKQRDDKAISQEITRAAMAVGVIPDGIPDIIGAAIRDGWAVNDRGEMELRDPKSGAVAFDVTPETWAAAQAKGQRRYLFQNGQSGQQPGGGGGLEKNPWSKDTWSDTEQALLYKANPAKAEQMAKAAGSCIGALDPRLGPSKPAY